jgi:hypothetical protein
MNSCVSGFNENVSAFIQGRVPMMTPMGLSRWLS